MKRKITKEEVMHVARLARIKLSEEEIEKFQAQFEDILGFIDQLGEVETGGIDPVSQVTDSKNILRKDEVEESLPKKDIVKDHSGYFVVPKVIE